MEKIGEGRSRAQVMGEVTKHEVDADGARVTIK